MTANEIESLENAARSVFGHDDTEGTEIAASAPPAAPSLFARLLDYVQKRVAVAPPAMS